MNIELGRLSDGSLTLVSDAALPAGVQRIEYYRDQRLLMMVYDDPAHEGDLLNCELSDDTAAIFERSPNLVFIVSNALSPEAYGYFVPLIRVGI